MDEPDADKTPPSLQSAVRKARVEQAERSDAVSDLRRAELARLEILHDMFKPILAQVPPQVTLFDCGIAAGDRPRLFIDMIAFVEMAHDKRTYTFVQETRHGRLVIAETEKVERMVDAMTDYVARRLVEREAALAADLTKQYALKEARGGGKAAPLADVAAAQARPKSRFRRSAESALLFTIELLGAIVLFILLIGAAYFLWRYAEGLWVAHYAQLR